jgi:beta-mannosidase
MLHEQESAVTLPPLSSTDVAKLSDGALFGAADPRSSYAVVELILAGKTVSRAIVERAEPKDMAYPVPGLTSRWNGKTLTLTATNIARAVMIGFGTIPAIPSDNGFDLLPGESITVTIQSEADAATLQRALVLQTLGPV